MSVPRRNEIWVIDHSTTTEEAAGHTASRWGRGGDLLYRWGNPGAHGHAGDAERQLGFQHDVRWVSEGRPGAGHLTLFNNRIGDPEPSYSAVFELVPPTAGDGRYLVPDTGPFGPEEPTWRYVASDRTTFCSSFISGAHRLVDGNTFITAGAQGRFFEVTSDGEIVWEYWTPYAGTLPGNQATNANPYSVFRATKVAPNHPALAGRELAPLDPQPPAVPPPDPGPGVRLNLTVPCHRRRKNGTCSNRLRIAVATLNGVLDAIEKHALTPEAVEPVVQLTERDDVRDRQDALHRDRKDVERRIALLVSAIETGGDAPSLVAKVRELEARRGEIDGDLRSLQPVPRLAPPVVEDRLAEWRRLLRQSTTQGRAVLQRVLRGRITFTPKGGGYEFEAETRFDKLFTGVSIEPPPWVVPYLRDTRGAEHIGPDDTFDGDYGRLLERAAEQREKGGVPNGTWTLLDNTAASAWGHPCGMICRKYGTLLRERADNGRDRVDHAPGAHDDRANAGGGCPDAAGRAALCHAGVVTMTVSTVRPTTAGSAPDREHVGGDRVLSGRPGRRKRFRTRAHAFRSYL